jgi:hypothetical protein
VQFRLRIEWKRATAEDSAQVCPTMSDGSYTCEAIPMTCDVRVRVRIVGATNDETYFSECYRIENNGDACLLADLPIAPREIPNEMVKVQVIVWTVEELEASGIDLSLTDGCPVTTPFELSGLPRLAQVPTSESPPREPVPAMGGQSYFQVGQSPVATVTMGCGQWDSLNALVCRDNSVTLEATIRDPRTFSSVTRMQSEIMEVRFGVPEDNGEGGYLVNFDTFSQGLAKTASRAAVAGDPAGAADRRRLPARRGAERVGPDHQLLRRAADGRRHHPSRRLPDRPHHVHGDVAAGGAAGGVAREGRRVRRGDRFQRPGGAGRDRGRERRRHHHLSR